MKRRIMHGGLAAVGILLLILDTRTALAGATDGIGLCIRSIVPSIFPFLVLSGILTSVVLGANLKPLRPLGRLMGIAQGAEGIFLTGLVGGYPIGAQSVYQAWEYGQLNAKDARRMLAFCSNAGPSFLFGILGIYFTNIRTLWMLWTVQLLSATVVGILLPEKSRDNAKIIAIPVTLPQALNRSVSTMGAICGWVVLFRVILAYLDRWVLWTLPITLQVVLHGFLELANGCCQLSQISSEGLRFIIASGMLSFGGICVLMQTVSVTEKLGIGQYLVGKIMQTVISLLLSTVLQNYLFASSDKAEIPPLSPFLLLVLFLMILVFYRKIEKKSSIPAAVGV